MMTSSRPRDVGGSFSGRRGHASQLSISDPSHHVTEAIGTLYGDGDDDDYGSGSESLAPPPSNHGSLRPMSFVAAPYGDHIEQQTRRTDQSDQRTPLLRSISDKSGITLNSIAHPHGGISNGNSSLKKATTMPVTMGSQRNSTYDGPLPPMSPLSPLSPSPSLRDFQSDSGSQFPLTNIDNPTNIAQELSNLQALRRMSMDVSNNSDPDLLPFSGLSLMAMPSVAPTGDDDEGDPSRLLWVPARVHPELEPNAFKSFLEDRVQTIKRRSGESLLSVEGLQQGNSGSLRRKKSMLSRQIDNTNGSGAEGYTDGTERLESEHFPPELSLNELVRDPTKAVQKLAQDARAEGTPEGDLPILPVAPGMGLRRSTRTTYRKGGSLRYGDRAPFSKRIAAARQAEQEPSEEHAPVPDVEPPPPRSAARVKPDQVTENFSRPTRSVKRQQNFTRDQPLPNSAPDGLVQQEEYKSLTSTSQPHPQEHPIRTSSQRAAASIPEIVETPPPHESSQSARPFPERSSSQHTSQQRYSDEPPLDGPPARSSRRPGPGRPVQQASAAAEPAEEAQKATGPESSVLNDMATHPSPLPGTGSLRTDSLTFIPTLHVSEEKEDKKADRKSKDQDDNESVASSKSWKWFRTDDKDKKKKKEKEKEKEKERTKERDREEQAKKAKGKASGDKGHDNARLDVLQSSIDNVVAKGRESLLLDRDSVNNKLQEERRKESSRKSTDGKKDKDGFFGGLFGGSKRKGDRDSHGKKKDQRALSPEPPARILRPDVDYAWSRFTIIEERAIYRMAHIKLANPRRSLQSQVLLSNFMYSYLAKVQAMHPQLQVPVSPQQKRQEEERKRREAEQAQQQLEQQQMLQSGGQDGNFNFEYHRNGNQYGDHPQNEGDGYGEDTELYEYDHGGEIPEEEASGHGQRNGGSYQMQDDHGDQSKGQSHSRQGNGGQGYYQDRDDRHYEGHGREDMW